MPKINSSFTKFPPHLDVAQVTHIHVTNYDVSYAVVLGDISAAEVCRRNVKWPICITYVQIGLLLLNLLFKVYYDKCIALSFMQSWQWINWLAVAELWNLLCYDKKYKIFTKWQLLETLWRRDYSTTISWLLQDWARTAVVRATIILVQEIYFN